MATPLKIKDGKIILPGYIPAPWRNAEIEIHEYNQNRIILERSIPERRKKALASLKAAAGILKGKIPDPVRWQRKIRKEWDRPLPRLHVHR
ncbi:MAG: hypothetical protein AAB539_00780 [Patescibacteria group bacterium]